MGYFDLKNSDDGQFYFNLHAANGEVIANSERYTTKQAALNGIESVKKHAPNAEVRDNTKK